jgi:RHS repeat-associated protein
MAVLLAQSPVATTVAMQKPLAPAPAAPRPPSSPPVVHVNRTVPHVAAPALAPAFSGDPADAEFFRARIFVEPLVPVGRATTPDENRALARALLAYAQQKDLENVTGILAVFQSFPASPWKASVMANVGTVFARTGRFTRALAAWEDAWRLAKDAPDPMGHAVADYALGERLDLLSKVGNVAAMSAAMAEIKDRDVRGSAGEKVDSARQTLWVLEHRHELATPSGVVAISAWLTARPGEPRRETAGAGDAGRDASRDVRREVPRELRDYRPSGHGMSLAEVRALAERFGLRTRMAYREPSAAPVVPALVHLQVGHFSLLAEAREGRYLLRDSILGDHWLSPQALNEEWSGYALVQSAAAPPGWRDVAAQEADATKGYCIVGKADQGDAGPCSPNCGTGGKCRPGQGGPPTGPNNPNGPAGPPPNNSPSGPPPPTRPTGLATYDFHPVTAALRLTDVPVGYTPPIGPAVMFGLTYNHRDPSLAQIPTFGNLGPKWEFDWFSSVIEYPGGGCGVYGCDFPSVTISLRGFGTEEYAGSPSLTEDFGYNWRSRARLVRVSRSPIRYERQLPDGSTEVFTLSNGALEGQRTIFMTSIIDPQGQAVQLTYDAQFRIVAITDAVGQVTTLSYAWPGDPLKLTKVTDPFGRFATFSYTAAGQLASITDVIGLTSSFTYTGGDFVAALTTPYGKTLFRKNPSQFSQWIEATDPLGGTERLEFWIQDASLPTSLPANQVATGFTAYNEHLDFFNSYYWDKRAMALYPGDRTKATLTHWLINRPVQYLAPYDFLSSSVVHSVKRPLESRIWFAYPNQDLVTPRGAGDGSQPSKTARVLDDGSSQIWQASYNAFGRVTSQTDPLGRQTTYLYAGNGVDLLEMRQATAGAGDLLASFGNYTAQHRPETVTNAAGQTTTYTHNVRGQVLTATNAKSETTTYTYEAGGGSLQSVTGPVAGAAIGYAYDGYGRLRSVTDPDGYTSVADYDVMDRPTRMTFPDGSDEQTTYDRLDATAWQDRLGRVTRTVYDPLRRVVSTRDPLGRVVTRQWCACGSLEALLDGKGQKTSWEHDLEGRVTREVRDDGSTVKSYTYEATTGRVKMVTDAKGQVTTKSYNLDDTLASRTYTNATIATAPVNYTYDTYYNRIVSIVDGTGTTLYSYKPVGVLGATLLASVDGPITSDNVVYEYDELSRVAQRLVNGVSHAFSYDALGRLSGEVNALGAFFYSYDGATGRVASITFPNGQTSSYSYLTNAGDRRLQTIHHKYPNGSTLSKFDYSYDAAGNLLTWRQQADSDQPTEWRYTYDAADQLLDADRWSTDGTPARLTHRSYMYDLAGNRIVDQVDTAVMLSTFDRTNRLTGQQPGGAVRVAGTVSEPATVTIQGQPASVGSTQDFSGSVPVATGTNTFTVAATDASGNTRTQAYQVAVSGPTHTYTYDANGNMTSNGAQTFEWDATDGLVAIADGVKRFEFALNGWHQQTGMVVRESGAVTAAHAFVWCGTRICEDRDASSGVVEQRFFNFGAQQSGANFYYATDHLVSVREVLAQNGTLVRRDDYDPYGVRSQLVGAAAAFAPGFASQTALDLGHLSGTQFRPYDPALGRWLSEDPIGLRDGTNRYAYVSNAPTGWIDPLGLITLPPTPKDLPPGWRYDPTHKDPNGERWRAPNDKDYVDFHRGRDGEKGWKGRDHWHWNGKNQHYAPGDEIPDPEPPPVPEMPGRPWWSYLDEFMEPLIIIVNPCYTNPRFPGCPDSCPVTIRSSE